VSRETVRKAVADDLGLKSYVRVPRHLLTAKLKEKRLQRCKKVLAYVKSNGSTVRIFSDKKIFTVDQVYNRRNDRYIAGSTAEVEGVYRTKHPAQVMVLGVLASDGKKMPPYFFKVGEKVTSEVYYKVLRYVVLPWLKANYPNGDYVWTQDGAPCHTSQKIQKFCETNMANFWSKDFWPPSSPDLNPLDYFWWGAIETHTNATPHPNIESLKATITKVWTNYPEEAVRRACEIFRRRVEAVIEAEGGHIE
jgi:inhibitor of nuclear factor kappa-B kinase subunit alpha